MLKGLLDFHHWPTRVPGLDPHNQYLRGIWIEGCVHFCTPRNENEKTNIGALEHGHQDLGRLIDKWQTMAARRAQKSRRFSKSERPVKK